MNDYEYLVIINKDDRKELVYFYYLDTAEDYCVRTIETYGFRCELFKVNKMREYRVDKQ